MSPANTTSMLHDIFDYNNGNVKQHRDHHSLERAAKHSASCVPQYCIHIGCDFLVQQDCFTSVLPPIFSADQKSSCGLGSLSRKRSSARPGRLRVETWQNMTISIQNTCTNAILGAICQVLAHETQCSIPHAGDSKEHGVCCGLSAGRRKKVGAGN